MLENFNKKFNSKGEIYLRIKVRPNSAKTEIKEIMDDETVKIDVAAPPVKGKANSELVKFLAKEFNINKNHIKIISGVNEKIKLIKITRTI